MKPSTILPVAGSVLAIALVAIIAIVVTGGDADAPTEPGEPTPTLPEGTADPYGEEPVLGGNILDIWPEHRAQVPAGATLPPANQDDRSQGICAEVSFEDLPSENRLLWFQLAVDDQLVTQETTVFARGEDAQEAVICYDIDEPLAPGFHTAAIGVIDPGDLESEPRQLVAWAFDVVE